MPEPHGHLGERKFGTFYFGASGGQWLLYVDWNNDGIYDRNEGQRLLNVTTDRGRAQMFDSNGLAAQSVGQATLIMDNWDNRYTPWNTSSPIYPNSLPRRLALLQFMDTDGTTYNILKGYFSTGSPQIIDFVNPRVKFVLEDGWRLLDEADVSYPLTLNIATDTAIGHVLDEASWPTALGRSLDSGSDTLTDWWLTGKARDAVNSLANSEFGALYIAWDGKLTFANRRNNLMARTVIQITEDLILRSKIVLGAANDTVKNSITVQVHPVVIAAFGAIWAMGGVTQIDAGGTVSFQADYSYNGIACPATAVVTPVATTDYTANSKGDGTGVDMTASLSLTATINSNSALLVFTNSDATRPAYLMTAQIRGEAITQPNTQPVTATDTTSIAAYGKQQLTIDLPWQQGRDSATYLSDWLKSWLKDPAYPPRIVFEHQPTYGFAYDLNTKIILTLSSVGLDTRYRIGRIQHRWQGEGRAQNYETEWTLEPIDLNYGFYWQLDISQLGDTNMLIAP